MKILVFGASGMIGHKMILTLKRAGHLVYGSLHHAKEKYNLTGILDADRTMDLVDVTKFDKVSELLSTLDPDVVINAVGITLRRPEIQDATYCRIVNSEFPHFVQSWIEKNKKYFIHFSTDCVFDGKKLTEYTEDSPCDANDTYGLTKARGEVSGSHTLTLRGSQFGSELTGKTELFEWMLAQKGKTIKGYQHAIYSGVTTNVMAELVASLIGRSERLTGIYHASSPPISKFELLAMINQVFNLQATVVPDASYKSRKVLSSEKIAREIGFRCPSWYDMILELQNDRKQHSNLYGAL